MQDKNLQKFVVEYSPTQDAFHIQTVADALRKNERNKAMGIETDYYERGVFESYEDASNYIQNCREKQTITTNEQNIF